MKDASQKPPIGVVAALLASFAVIAAVGYFVMRRPVEGPTPDELAEIALTGASSLERTSAAVKLSDYGEEATEALRRVLAATNDPDVASTCVEGIGKVWDYESLDALINIVEGGPPKLSSRAAVVVGRMTGKDRRFQTTVSNERKREIVAMMRSDWETIRNAPPEDIAELKRRLRESHETD